MAGKWVYQLACNVIGGYDKFQSCCQPTNFKKSSRCALCRHVVNFTLRSLYLAGDRAPDTHWMLVWRGRWGAGWTSKPVWTLWRREILFPLPEIEPRFPCFPVRSCAIKKERCGLYRWPDVTYYRRNLDNTHISDFKVSQFAHSHVRVHLSDVPPECTICN